MNLHSTASNLASTGAQTLVIFTYQNGKELGFDLKNCGCDQAVTLVKDSHSQGRVKGGLKEVTFFRNNKCDGFEHILVLGLGDKKKITEETLRLVIAAGVKTLAREKVQSAAICLSSIRKLTKSAEDAGQALGEAAVMASYKYDELKSAKKEGEKDFNDLTFVLNDKAALKKFAEGLKRGEILGAATNFARDVSNSPGNYLTPTVYAERVHKEVKGLPIKFKAYDKKQIKELKMGCFLGVNKASAEEPRFIVLEYNGGKKSDKPFILVGKGLTFDTGGISLKPGAAMEEMKFDMCGSAAVIGATIALAKMKAKVNVVCLVPSTDNMPGGNAVKPGDVLVAMNGKTVEVNNTDAEGRLILADALCYACEKYEPAAIIDAATLTGACVVALGNVFSGVFSRDEDFLKQIQKVSTTTGERVWHLPLTDEYVDDMKGIYADLSNMANAKGGGASHGAAFLSQFVSEGVRWAHFDIAGTAYHSGGRLSYHPDKGASGVAVRLFAELAQKFK